jgi:hypothetical protein
VKLLALERECDLGAFGRYGVSSLSLGNAYNGIQYISNILEIVYTRFYDLGGTGCSFAVELEFVVKF